MTKLIIRVKTRAHKELEFAQIMESLIKEFRKGPGCLSNHFKREQDSEFRLASKWETMGELEKHYQSQLFSVLLGALHTLCESSEVKIVDGSRTLGMEAIDEARSK